MAGLGDRRTEWEPPGWGASLVGDDQELFATSAAGSSAHFAFFPTVAFVTPDGPAWRAGIRAGDVLTAVNGRSVLYPDAVRGMMLTGRTRSLVVQVMRSDSSFTTHLVP